MLVEKKQELGSLQQQVVELEGELSSLKLTRQQELGSLQQRVSQLEGENNKLRQTRESLEMASIQHDQAHMQILQRQVSPTASNDLLWERRGGRGGEEGEGEGRGGEGGRGGERREGRGGEGRERRGGEGKER